jgi:hypothetical protein
MKSAIEAYLSGRQHKAGETVQFGWFVFRIAAAGSPPSIESLDFRQMASFTDDFRMAEQIAASQTETLRSFSVSDCPCTLMQSALVSVSYSPGHHDAFLQRQESTDASDSGWYVGILHDPADMNDVATFSRRSLYELTIHDMRLAPFWLLPTQTTIKLRDHASFQLCPHTNQQGRTRRGWSTAVAPFAFSMLHSHFNLNPASNARRRHCGASA